MEAEIKQEGEMKRLIVLIAAITMAGIGSLNATQPANSANSIGPVAADVTQSTVIIRHTWKQMRSDGRYDISAKSLGTAIGPDLILTHNHFDQPLGHLPKELFTFDDAVGRTISWRPNDLQLTVSNAGTTLLRLPAGTFATHARPANGTTLKRLVVGVWLTVCYWDDRTGGLAQRKFQITHIKDGLVKLADPDRLINSGDSGGGAFLDDQLVGNTWSIDMDRADNPQGAFNVALIPAK
jgi:hypothetical protein